MHPADLAAADRILKELERRQKRNRIDSFFPTPENRAGYPVHMQFFEAGKTFRERLMMAANRCVSPWTEIETARGSRQCAEMLGAGVLDVRSWDGDFRCAREASGLFLKGIEPEFRVWTGSGRFFDCTRRHQVLTDAGWLSLGQIVRAASGLRYSRTPPDSTASCGAGGYPRGSRPLAAGGSGQGQPPSPGGAPGPAHYSHSQVGAAERRSRRIHSSEGLGRLPTLDDPDRISGLCARFADPAPCIDALWPSAQHPALRQLGLEFFQRQASPASESRQSSSELYAGAGNGSLDDSSTREAHELKVEGGTLFLESKSSGEEVQGFLDGALGSWIFLTLDAPAMVGGEAILAVVPLGLQPVLDFTVTGTACYASGGAIHHNTGKTESALCYETSLHLTGMYPDWWPGRRFDRPVSWWLGGDTSTTVRDIVQQKMLGPLSSQGTGLLRGDCILGTTNKRGVPDAVENVIVKHVTGGKSVLQFKSYDQGREAWQGTEQDGVGMDEEPPPDIYSEAVIRTMTTGGMVLSTFTPMKGLTEVTQSFLDIDKSASKFSCTATWDDVLHLDEATKKELWDSIPPHERQARARGVPTIGVGKIYPVDIEALLVDPFDLPKHWPRGYGMDVGWNRTAAVWGALDRDSDTLYLYSEHYMGQAEPAVHASAIRSRGDLVGLIDPASRGRSQHDGSQLLKLYSDPIENGGQGLRLQLADNAVEAGIFDVYQRMTSGRIKIFKTLQNLQKELAVYHRDEHGKVVKKNDHLMDTMRYLVRGTPQLSYTNTAGNFATTSGGQRYLTSRPRRYG